MSKILVGITGQSGFVGTHLYNTLRLYLETFELIWFEDNYFENINTLAEFTRSCDFIVHLAAVNRHHDPNEIFNKNLELVDKLIGAMSLSHSKAHVIFSSSIQEERDNVYGKSKKEGRKRLAEWAAKNNSGFTGLVIPNVFGPFGRPYYNSVISTFSYQLCNNETPKIEIDAELNFIYISDLIKEIIKVIEESTRNEIIEYRIVKHTATIKVSDILTKLVHFNKEYKGNGIIPSLDNKFDIDLFNSFRSYLYDTKHFPFEYKVNKDERGVFVEVMKLYTGGQVSFSTTAPGVTRGNHFHTRKIERFAVIKGEALIQLRKIGTDQIINYHVNGAKPSFVDIPVWYTHNIKNTGNEGLLTLFWINEFYNPNEPDTYFEKV